MNMRQGCSKEHAIEDVRYGRTIEQSDFRERLDRLANIVKKYFSASFVFISLVEQDQVCVLAKKGDETKHEQKNIEYYSQLILNSMTEEPDTRLYESVDSSSGLGIKKESDKNNVGELSYYLAFVLKSRNMDSIGMLCMKNTTYRTLAKEDKDMFIDLGCLVESEVNKIKPSLVCSVEKEDAVLDYENFLNVFDSYEVVKDKTDELLKDRGINYNEWRVLNSIIRAEKSIPREISSHAHLSKPLVSRYLSSLEAKGLIQRSYASEIDKRYVYIACTKDGEQLWDYGVKHIVNFIHRIYTNVLIKTNV